MLKYSYVNVRFSISSTRFVRPRWATRGACARTNRARMAVVAVVLGSCSSPRRGVDGDFKMSFVIFLYALRFMLKYVLLELSFCIVFMYYWICTIGFWLIFLCDWWDLFLDFGWVLMYICIGFCWTFWCDFFMIFFWWILIGFWWTCNSAKTQVTLPVQKWG